MIVGITDEAQASRKFHGLLARQTCSQINGLFDYGVGVLQSHLFDIGAALSARDDHWSLICTLESHGEVELASGEHALANHERVARLALAACLLGI